WALVQAHSAPLASYLALAEGMRDSVDSSAWQQINNSLGMIEYDERGTPGHDAFAAYARSVIKPVADRLGWNAKADETPDLQNLRRTVIQNLGVWGDAGVIAEARRRFAAFVKDRSAVTPDDQPMILTIVGLRADKATFEQLHMLARQSTDDSDPPRLYIAPREIQRRCRAPPAIHRARGCARSGAGRGSSEDRTRPGNPAAGDPVATRH